MTELAFNGGMCASQREIRIVVIEASAATGGMAGITCLAVVCVAPNALVLFIHVGLEVRMAVNTTENSIVIRIGMTISTRFPLAIVTPGVDREVLTIVIKGGRHPGVYSMAGLAVGRELG